MKALTLHEPWATLVALGIKTIETRSWSTSYRGPLAIHAGAKRPAHFWTRWGELVRGEAKVWEPFVSRIDLACFVDHEEAGDGYFSHSWRGELGAVVATCTLQDVVPIVPRERWPGEIWPTDGWCRHITPRLGGGLSRYAALAVDEDLTNAHHRAVDDQEPYGDFAPGRYAWLLSGVRRLDEPVPVKGHQRLWEWEPPCD